MNLAFSGSSSYAEVVLAAPLGLKGKPIGGGIKYFGIED